MSLPISMLAIEFIEPGGPDVLHPASVATPVPGHGQIIVKLAYAGVNRPDALQRAGKYAPPPGASPLPGLEGAGEVVALGPGVTRWKLGDQVCALLPGGGYAEFARTHEDHAMAVPKGLSLAEAASLPETCLTVWSNLVLRGGLKAGQKVLIHGGSSGIGVTAIQMARAIGARVFTTVGTDRKAEACRELGAEVCWNYHDQDFSAEMQKLGGADVILDMVGGKYIPRNIAALADDGRLVQIAFLQGAKVDLDLAQVMTRRLTITGSTLRPQSDLAKANYARAVEKHIWPLIEKGRFKPVIDSEYALDEAAKAHWRLESSAHIGKIMLRVI